MVCSTLLETVFSVFNHIWTQDIPVFPLTFGGKTGPYIDRGGSKLKVLVFLWFAIRILFSKIGLTGKAACCLAAISYWIIIVL